jgi:hypothetical protein
MSNDLAKKLRLPQSRQALILNAPESFIYKLEPLPENLGLHELSAVEKSYDFVLTFLRSIAEVESWAPEAIRAVHEEGLLWMAYPKQSGKIKTDINRDTGWQTVAALGYEGVSLIAIDETWSAMRFRASKQIKSPRSARIAATGSASKSAAPAADRIVVIPDDLAEAFKTSPTASSFYESLSYTNRKEYVRWITDAKREETRSGRIAKTIDKLERGLKNPTLKE